MAVGRLLSVWEWLCSGAILVLGRVGLRKSWHSIVNDDAMLVEEIWAPFWERIKFDSCLLWPFLCPVLIEVSIRISAKLLNHTGVSPLWINSKIMPLLEICCICINPTLPHGKYRLPTIIFQELSEARGRATTTLLTTSLFLFFFFFLGADATKCMHMIWKD